jgi:hypothetical protein
MTRLSRDKGARREREIVAAHCKLGIKAERVPLSGVARHRGNGADVDLYIFGPDSAPIVCEVCCGVANPSPVALAGRDHKICMPQWESVLWVMLLALVLP